jgi:NAD(P)-dependent dehydrogenase (short-subunit alcohol dehydrogenase family)
MEATPLPHSSPRPGRRGPAGIGMVSALLGAALLLPLPAAAQDTESVLGPGASPEDPPVALVTGSTDGLGRALALSLAEDGYHVIVHGRSEARGAEVVRAIEAVEGSGGARFMAADFASLEEVAALALAVQAHYARLDLLVNNAGVGPGAPGHERVLTPDGHELRFQVNYLAGYLLTRELLPLLRRGAPSRVVNVTSRNQRPLDFRDLRLDRDYSGGEAYGRSKLAQILHVHDLAMELQGTGVTAVAVHPAPAMDTELVREAGGTPQSTVADGLAAVRNAIFSDLPSGTFFFEKEPRPAHDQAYDPEARRVLRELSEGYLTGLITPATGDDGEAAAAVPARGLGAPVRITSPDSSPSSSPMSRATVPLAGPAQRQTTHAVSHPRTPATATSLSQWAPAATRLSPHPAARTYQTGAALGKSRARMAAAAKATRV